MSSGCEESHEMTPNKRHAYDAEFKLEAIGHAVTRGNRAAAKDFNVHESMVRKWRKHEDELRRVKKPRESFRRNKARPLQTETSEMPGATGVTGEVEGEEQSTRSERAAPSALKPLHLLNSQGEYECRMCQETFATLAHLAKHVQFHDRERPYPCLSCSKRFLSRSHHHEHQRVHTGERPFLCHHCDRSFTTHHNLKRHQRIHEKEEAFRCGACGALFCQEHQPGNLSSIIRVLEQHRLVDPENPKEPGGRTKPGRRTSGLKEEPEEQEHTHPGSDENRSPAAPPEDEPGSAMFPSRVERVHDRPPKASFRIKQIAYDIEVVL